MINLLFCLSLIVVSVTEVVFDSSIEDIQWLGSNYRTVICRSSGGRLYRSLDSGRNWSEITDLLKIVAEADTREEIFVRNIIVNPTDKDVVIVVGKKDFHFRSVDSARTFSLLDHLESIHNFLFHPTKPHWALMSRWTDACTSTSLTATSKFLCKSFFVCIRVCAQSHADTIYSSRKIWGKPLISFLITLSNILGVTQRRAKRMPFFSLISREVKVSPNHVLVDGQIMFILGWCQNLELLPSV